MNQTGKRSERNWSRQILGEAEVQWTMHAPLPQSTLHPSRALYSQVVYSFFFLTRIHQVQFETFCLSS